MSTIPATTCQIFIEKLTTHGIHPKALLVDVEITLADLQDANCQISEAQYIQIAKRYAELIQEKQQAAPLNQMLVHEQWGSLLKNIPAFVSVVDIDGRFQYLNHSLGGEPLENYIGQLVWQWVPPEQQLAFQKALKTALDTQIPQSLDTSPMVDGVIFAWFENTITPLYNNDDPIGNVVMSRDITDQYKTRQEIEKRAQQLRVVAEFSSQLKTLFDVSELIQNVCDLTKEGFGLYHAHIYLTDDDNEQLILEAGAGDVGRQLVETRRSFRISEGAEGEVGLVAEVARTKTAIISNDVTQFKNFRFNEFLPNTKSEMGLPILLNSRLLGVLDVQADQVNFFSEQDRSILQTLADQVAIAIQNAQLYENIIQQWETANTLRDIGLILGEGSELNDRLLDVLSEIYRVLPFTAASIWLRDPATGVSMSAVKGYTELGLTPDNLQFKYGVTSTPLLQRLSQVQRPIIISNTVEEDDWLMIEGFEWVRSWAAAPIMVRGAVIGHINLDHKTNNFYQVHHEPILEVITRQLSLAVENVTLFNEEQRQREIAETLRDIGAVLASSLEQDDILQLVLAQVARVLPYDAAAIWLLDEENIFYSVAHYGYQRFDAVDKIERLKVKLSDRDFDRPHAYIISDTGAYDDWVIMDGFDWVRSWAMAPIIVRDKMIGKLALDHTTPNFYTPDVHIPVLNILTTQISLAVGNARLYENERRQRQQFEALQRGNVSLSQSLNLSEVLSAILEATFELVPAQDTYIYLYENERLMFGAERHTGAMPNQIIYSEPRKNGLTYHVARTGQTMIVEDLHHDKRIAPYPKDQWLDNTTSLMGVALTFGERVVGVMNLTFSSVENLRRVDVPTLQLMANQASIAIENARLFKATQEYAADLEERVEQRTDELNQERAQLHVILNGMGEGVIYDHKYKVRYTNQKLTEMTGYTPPPNATIRDVMIAISADPPDTAERLDTIFKDTGTKGVWQGELRIKNRSGTEFDANVFSTGIRNEQGEVVGAVTIIRDVSQEKALQAQKDRFISNASHELRTPITNIQTRLYLMKKRPDKTAEHLQVVEEVTQQMAQLVSELLDLSRFERGVMRIEPQKVVLQELLQDILAIQSAEAEKKQIDLKVNLPSIPLMIELDIQRIQQVFTNLITNAINYTESGGQIVIRASQNAQFVTVYVKDTGIGVPIDLQEQIFQPFFRAKEGVSTGTGLGLSIAQEIVHVHYGTITLESVEGEGSTFIVKLPKTYQQVQS